MHEHTCPDCGETYDDRCTLGEGHGCGGSRADLLERVEALEEALGTLGKALPRCIGNLSADAGADRAVLRVLARAWLAKWPRCQHYDREVQRGCGRFAQWTYVLGPDTAATQCVCVEHSKSVRESGNAMYFLPKRLRGIATLRTVRRWLRETR